MIVLPTPFIPGEKNSRIVPVLALHDRIDLLCDKVLASFHLGRRMTTWVTTSRSYPGNVGHVTRLNVLDKLSLAMNIVWRLRNILDQQRWIPRCCYRIVFPTQTIRIKDVRQTVNIIAGVSPVLVPCLIL